MDRLLRLMMLTLVGTCLGYSFFGVLGESSYYPDELEWKLAGAIIGALSGVGGELLLRQLDSRIPKLSQLRFSLRTLFIGTTVVAFLLGLIFAVWR